MSPRQLTVGTLFRGAGGADLGLEAAGMRVIWQCEIDKGCNAVARVHWPGVPIHGDVKTMDPDAFEVPDIIWFSPPCQDISVAGAREGLKGARSGLFHHATRLIQRFAERGTQLALMEQVPGLFSSNDRADFREVVQSLLSIGAREIGWAVLDSQWFGVPQRRDRIFFVADFRAERAGEILALSYGLQGHTAPRSKTEKRIANALSAGSAGKSNKPGRRQEDDFNVVIGLPYDADEAIPIGNPGAKLWTGGECGPSIGEPGDPMYCLETKRIHAVAYPIDAQALRPGEALTPSADAEGVVRLRNPGLAIGDAEDPSPCLNASGPHAVAQVAYQVTFNDANGVRSDRPDGGCYVTETDQAPALTASPDNGLTIIEPAREPVTYDLVQVTNIDNRSNPQPGDPCQTLNAQGQAVVVQPPNWEAASEVTGTISSSGAGVDRTGNSRTEDEFLVVGHDPQMVQWASGGGEVLQNSAQALRASAEHSYQFLQTGMSVRRLTPRECERLQGWTDDHTRFGTDDATARDDDYPLEAVPPYWEHLPGVFLEQLVTRGTLRMKRLPGGAVTYLAKRIRLPDGRLAFEIADATRYRMMGNGVTRQVAEDIGRRAVEFFDSHGD